MNQLFATDILELAPSGQPVMATEAGADSNPSIFDAPWDRLDDAGLLAHFRAPRAVQYYPVADADETQPSKIEALMAGRFQFNGETHLLPDPIDWLTNPSHDLEWHILLHKFYYAVGLGIAFRRSGDPRYAGRWLALTESWMAATPPGFIAADVTGRRIQNWIYSYHYFVTHATGDSAVQSDPAFHRRLLLSIHDQVEYLRHNLTAKRNHRTLELYAIFLAGVVFPEMRLAAQWRAFALEQTVANIASDLLSDGVHCELSTDYHHLVLKNYLNVRRLAALNGIAVPAPLDQALQRALEFSMHVHKPDGIVPSLSDGDARSFLDLLQQGAELYDRSDLLYVATRGQQGAPPSQRVALFPASGYSVIRSDWGNGGTAFADAQYLVFDSGPLGEGNHGHFDCLSFELAAHGRSLIVDPGRYTYSEAVNPADGVNWRLHFRGTASHNTVCVDGRQQTRYIAKQINEASRHARGSVRHKISGPAPQAQLTEHFECPYLDLLHGEARSDEYDAVHQRCIVFVDRRYWIVSDWLRADSEHEYVLSFQLGPHAEGHAKFSLTDRSIGLSGGLRVRSPGLLIAQPARAGMRHALCPGWVSASYGDKQAAPMLRSSAIARNADFDTVLLPWHAREPVVMLEDSLVETDREDLSRSARALRISLMVDGESVTDTWFHARGKPACGWRTGRFEIDGRWAYWRESADGRVLRAVSHAGATLHETTPHGRQLVALGAKETR